MYQRALDQRALDQRNMITANILFIELSRLGNRIVSRAIRLSITLLVITSAKCVMAMGSTPHIDPNELEMALLFGTSLGSSYSQYRENAIKTLRSSESIEELVEKQQHFDSPQNKAALLKLSQQDLTAALAERQRIQYQLELENKLRLLPRGNNQHESSLAMEIPLTLPGLDSEVNVWQIDTNFYNLTLQQATILFYDSDKTVFRSLKSQMGKPNSREKKRLMGRLFISKYVNETITWNTSQRTTILKKYVSPESPELTALSIQIAITDQTGNR